MLLSIICRTSIPPRPSLVVPRYQLFATGPGVLGLLGWRRKRRASPHSPVARNTKERGRQLRRPRSFRQTESRANYCSALATLLNVFFYIGTGELHGSDDRDRNSGSDETVLDGGRARVVSQETHNEMHAKIMLGNPIRRFKPIWKFLLKLIHADKSA